MKFSSIFSHLETLKAELQKDMKVLVTGATGLVGNNVVRKLLASGFDVSVTVRPTSNMKSLDGLDVRVLKGDLIDKDFLNSLVNNVDAIIHSAALIQIGWSKMDQSLKVNVEASSALAEAAAKNNIRLVYVSTVDTLAKATRYTTRTENDREPAKPQCAYVVSKTKGEKTILEWVGKGLDAVIVHPGFMVGPWDWAPSSGEMMLAIAKNWVPFSPGGGCSVVDVRDVATGIISALKNGKRGERYILGGVNMTYLQLWRLMANTVGKRGPIAPMGWGAAKTIGFFGDVVSKIRGKEGQVNSAALQMGQIFHFYDSKKAIENLDYKIGDVETALQDAWRWFIEYGYAKRKKSTVPS